MSKVKVQIKVFTADIDGIITKTFYAIDGDGQMVGKLDISDWEQEGAFITRLFVCKLHRGFGIARKLMNAVFKEAKEAGKSAVALSVKKGNTAIELYKKLGFQPIYLHGDHTVMSKHL